MQQPLSQEFPVLDGSIQSKGKSVKPLPAEYTYMPTAALRTPEPQVPELVGPCVPNVLAVKETLQHEYSPLDHLRELVGKPALDKEDYISWTAYSASHQPWFTDPLTNIALLPLFLENAHTVAMINHSMNVVNGLPESRTNTSDGHGSATLCPRQKHSVEFPY